MMEQNFARLNESDMSILIDGLSEAELSDLAQLYVNAITDQGLQPKLIQVMAHRLDAERLGRVSKHFGFGTVYAAVTALAPAKTQDFLKSSNPNHMGPAPGEMRFGPMGRYAPARSANVSWADYALLKGNFRATTSSGLTNAGYMVPNAAWRSGLHNVAGFGQFMTYTPYEIYLDFRTAPVGALGVTGALWETSVVLSSTLTLAYGTGYAIGMYAVAPLLQTYAPALYDAIGGTIANIIETLTAGWSTSTTAEGNAQKATAPSFAPTGAQMSSFQGTGGDYGVSDDWSMERLEGAGGGCIGTVCKAPY